MIYVVVWVVLMMFWLFYGGYTLDHANPVTFGTTLIPWLCVLILGLFVFGAIGTPPVSTYR